MGIEITQAKLKELLRYDRKTGVFTWQPRGIDSFPCRKSWGTWNTRYAWKVAGTNRNGYVAINIRPKIYQAHRLAWLYIYGAFPSDQIDHINHIRSDNRLVNLREATSKDNNRNSSRFVTNTSGVSGVAWDKSRNAWLATIWESNKQKNLGRYKSFHKAVTARKQAEREYGYHENHGS